MCHIGIKDTVSSKAAQLGIIWRTITLAMTYHAYTEAINVTKDTVLVVPTSSLWYYFSVASSQDSVLLRTSMLEETKSHHLKLFLPILYILSQGIN